MTLESKATYSEVCRVGEEDGPAVLDPLVPVHGALSCVRLKVRNGVAQTKNLHHHEHCKVKLYRTHKGAVEGHNLLILIPQCTVHCTAHSYRLEWGHDGGPRQFGDHHPYA